MSENKTAVNFRFHFKRMCEKMNYRENPMFEQPRTKPNANYIYQIIKEKKSQTLFDIWVGLGWRSTKDQIAISEVHPSVGMEIGKLINFHMPKRDFSKVEIEVDGEIMKVRTYLWYEVPFIVSIIFSYFHLYQYIPKQWDHGFYIHTNVLFILKNMIPLHLGKKSDLCKIVSENSSYLNKLQNMMINDIPDLNVINTNHIYRYSDNIPLYTINGKYGIAIELYILQNIEKVFM
jgi:hypothetical protein